MSDLTDLYQEVILDHYKKPRNFREMPECSHHAEGTNPLCGDRITIYLQIDDNNIVQDVSFQGSGCAISKASASLMTAEVKGKSREQAGELFDHVRRMLTGETECPPEASLGKLRVLSGVCEYPTRVKCATLAWHALSAAMQGEDNASTE